MTLLFSFSSDLDDVKRKPKSTAFEMIWLVLWKLYNSKLGLRISLDAPWKKILSDLLQFYGEVLKTSVVEAIWGIKIYNKLNLKHRTKTLGSKALLCPTL